MRVEVTPRRLEAVPGISQRISVTIVNTETIIGGYSVRVLGADPGWVEVPDETISLFPDDTHTMAIGVTVPRGLAAGSRRIAVQVRELTPPEASSVVEIDIVVPAEPQVQVQVDPLALTAGKRAAFSLMVENTGNTQVIGFLAGDDEEQEVLFRFEPDRVALAPGQHTVVDMRASAKRRFFGSPTVRTLGLHLDQEPEDAFFDERYATAPERRARDETDRLATATFIQKSVMSRGFLSLLGLLFAATVFAVVIVVALSKLVGQSTADRNLALQVAQARNQTATTGTSGVSGTVTLLTSGKPVPGVAVSVFSASDTSSPIATTATDARGGFAVTDLVAGKYKVSFRGAGFVELWYPAAATDADATTLTLAAGQVQGGLNVSLGGTPATISGSVIGDDVSAATLFLMTLPPGGTTVQASNVTSLQPQDPTPGVVTPPDNGGAVVQRVPIGTDGSFNLTNVPSPSVYDLVVVKTGYATSTQRIDIGAGEHRTGVQITLSKGDGVISGTVTSATGPLGGATITATSGQSTANTVSLTGASAGQFTLRSLPTPATFTVVASKVGFASQTLSLALAAGQKLTGVAITLNQSSGALNGVVTLLPGNSRVGGVGVTVSNGATTVQTATDSSNNVGSWHVGGLPVPSTYTVTFSRSDLQSQTVSVSLDAAGNVTPGSAGTRLTSDGIAVSMQSSTATVAGTITQTATTHCSGGGSGLGEASVSLSSGTSTYSVTSASVAPNCGRYRLELIPPGTYTLTVAAGSGTSPSSKVITVTAGQISTQNVNLSRPASLSGTVAHCPTASCPGGAGLQARPGWSVFLYLQTDYPFQVDATTITASNGTFAFNNLAAGNYIVAAGPTTDPANATNTLPKIVHPSTNETITVLVNQ